MDRKDEYYCSFCSGHFIGEKEKHCCLPMMDDLRKRAEELAEIAQGMVDADDAADVVDKIGKLKQALSEWKKGE